MNQHELLQQSQLYGDQPYSDLTSFTLAFLNVTCLYFCHENGTFFFSALTSVLANHIRSDVEESNKATSNIGACNVSKCLMFKQQRAATTALCEQRGADG